MSVAKHIRRNREFRRRRTLEHSLGGAQQEVSHGLEARELGRRVGDHLQNSDEVLFRLVVEVKANRDTY